MLHMDITILHTSEYTLVELMVLWWVESVESYLRVFIES